MEGAGAEAAERRGAGLEQRRQHRHSVRVQHVPLVLVPHLLPVEAVVVKALHLARAASVTTPEEEVVVADAGAGRSGDNLSDLG